MPQFNGDGLFFCLVHIGADEQLWYGYGEPRTGKYVAIPMEGDSELNADILLNEFAESTADFFPAFDPSSDIFAPPLDTVPKKWLDNLGGLKLVMRTLINPALAVNYVERVGLDRMRHANRTYARSAQDLVKSGDLDTQTAYARVEWAGWMDRKLDEMTERQEEGRNQDAMRDAMRKFLEGGK